MKSTKYYYCDDKRFALNDSIHTLAYFHKDLKNRLTRLIINKRKFKKILIKRRDFFRSERFKKILIKRRNSHRWLQIKISAYK